MEKIFTPIDQINAHCLALFISANCVLIIKLSVKFNWLLK